MDWHIITYNIFISNQMNPQCQVTPQYFYLSSMRSLTPSPLWSIYNCGPFEHSFQSQFSVAFYETPFQQTQTTLPEKDIEVGQATQNQEVQSIPVTRNRRSPRKSKEIQHSIQGTFGVDAEDKEDDNDLQIRTKKVTRKYKTNLNKGSKSINHIKNKNRNIIPNMVQQMFSYLSKPTKSKLFIQKAFTMMDSSVSCAVSVQRYYSYFKQIKDKLNHYLDEKSLMALSTTHNIGINLYSQQEQGLYLKIARIAAKQFVDNHLPRLIIHSKRMYLDKRIEHLRARRVLTNALQSLHYQAEC